MTLNIGENTRPVGYETRAGIIDGDYSRGDHVHSIDSELLRDLVALEANKIDNPMFYHWQRTLPITGINQYTFDRWYIGAAGAGVISSAISTDAPVGLFPSSGLFTVTTVDSSIAAGDYMIIQQGVEGYRTQDNFMGTAAAKGMTLSFWAKSSLAGTYCVSLRDGNATYSYVKEYTLTANTWTFVTVFFPPTALGTWNLTNLRNCIVTWALSCGSTFQTSQGSWNNVNALATSNQVNWTATLSNTFRLTGVKLEVGRYATPFKTPDHVEELYKCRRYYQLYTTGVKAFTLNYLALFGASYSSIFPYIVPMRATPTARWGRTTLGDSNAYSVNAAGAAVDPLAVIIDPQSNTHYRAYCTGNYVYIDAVAGIEFSSEI